MSATTPTPAMSADDLANAALSLPPDDRAMIAHVLLDSVIRPFDDPGGVRQAWGAELARRIEDIRSGKVQLVDGREALLRIRGALEAKRGK